MHKKLGYSFFIAMCAAWMGYGIMKPVPVQAFGVSPATMYIKDVLPQTKLDRHFTITRGNEQQEEAKAVLTINNPHPDIIITAEKEIRLPAGESQVEYPFSIDFGNIASGTQLNIQMVYALEDLIKREGVARTLPVIAVDIVGTVSDQRNVDFEVRSVMVNVPETSNKVNVSMFVINEGNVVAGPDAMTIRVYDRNHKQLITEKTVRVEGEISPFSDQTIETSTKIAIAPPGVYMVDVLVQSKGKIVFERLNYPVQVLYEGVNMRVVALYVVAALCVAAALFFGVKSWRCTHKRR